MNMIDPRDVLIGIASQFVVHNKNIMSDCGILMSLCIEATNLGYEKDGRTFHEDWIMSYRKSLHFIVIKPHSVFVALSDDHDWKNVRMNKWKNTSNHDTCWRSDGFADVFPEVMKAYHACYDHVPVKHQPIPVSSYIHTSFSPDLQNPITFVSVITERNRDSDNHGYYVIKSINEINPKFPQLEGYPIR